MAEQELIEAEPESHQHDDEQAKQAHRGEERRVSNARARRYGAFKAFDALL